MEDEDGIYVSRSVILPRHHNWKSSAHARRVLSEGQLGPIWKNQHGSPSAVPDDVRERLADPGFQKDFGEQHYDHDIDMPGVPGVVANVTARVPSSGLLKPGDPEWDSHVEGLDVPDGSVVVRRGTPIVGGHLGIVNVAPLPGQERVAAPRTQKVPGSRSVQYQDPRRGSLVSTSTIWPEDGWATT